MSYEFGRQAERSLRRDVRRLGFALGEVLQRQAGEELYQLEEKIRTLAVKYRREKTDWARHELIEQISKLSNSEAQDIIRAFAIFCDLVNLAEEQHRIRTLDHRSRKAFPDPLEESVPHAVAELRNQGVGDDEMQKILDRLKVDLVFTAHPTEAKRRSVLSKLGRVGKILHELERHDPLPAVKIELKDRLQAEVTSLWCTEYARTARPTVTDEVRSGLYYFDVTLWDTVIKIQRRLERALGRYYPNLKPSSSFLTFGSWIGGDRDGNAFVTAETTAETLRLHRGLAVERHRKELRLLEQGLSISDRLARVSDEMRQLLKRAEQSEVEHIRYLLERYPNEPYRLLTALLVADLGETTADDVTGRLCGQTKTPLPKLSTANHLLQPLRAIDKSLRNAGLAQIADVNLNRVIKQLETFGLHTARLDIRQLSDRNTQVLSELLAWSNECENYQKLAPAEKTELLSKLLEENRPLPKIPREKMSEIAAETCSLFRILCTATEMYGKNIIGPYVISMTRGIEDVLTVLLFARWFGLSFSDNETEERLSIAPLFETRDDLRAAAEILRELYHHPAYKQHLVKRNNRQTVMIGYSDSNKDAGFVPANWELYVAQEALGTTCLELGINLTLFHGRGGSIARGGGPANRAILAQPPDSISGRLRFTEQGEMISERFGNPLIASRYLEQVISAVLQSGSPNHRKAAHIKHTWREATEELARYGYEAYRYLVYDTPEFLVYWQQATPIQEIGQLHLGSRPSKRSATEEFSGVRAIPWVFSWMQSRVTLPGWYGLGTACQKFAIDADRALLLVEMYQQWPFFNTLINNAQLSTAKADMEIAALYSELVEDRALASKIFGAIRKEFALSNSWILRITGQRELLDNEPTLKQAIQRRNPYIDPLNIVQIDQLRRLRALGDPHSSEAENIRRNIFHTIVGIAAGLKNTG